MIRRDELVKIGSFRKTHGIKGEISLSFSNDSFDESECPFLICEIDGIFVPFRIEEYRFKSDSSAFVKLKNVDTEEKAGRLTNKEVYFPKQYIKCETDKAYTWDYFIGFSIIDKHLGKIGTVIAVDDSTLNTLFIVEKDHEEALIPAANEIIMDMDESRKELFVELPDGLLDLK